MIKIFFLVIIIITDYEIYTYSVWYETVQISSIRTTLTNSLEYDIRRTTWSNRHNKSAITKRVIKRNKEIWRICFPNLAETLAKIDPRVFLRGFSFSGNILHNIMEQKSIRCNSKLNLVNVKVTADQAIIANSFTYCFATTRLQCKLIWNWIWY